MSIRRKMIGDRVMQLLSEAGITDAPVDVESIARSLGADVNYSPADDSLSGFLLRNEETGTAVIGVNSEQHPLRQRFTVAHELGHYLLHANERVHVDRREAGFQVKLRNETSSAGTDVEEMEANLFAAQLLMPAEFLRRDLAGYESLDVFEDDPLINYLKDKYQVSIRALTIRLTRLGYLEL
jgi:Zn-dependent peptidase ImmA (M78 family)